MGNLNSSSSEQQTPRQEHSPASIKVRPSSSRHFLTCQACQSPISSYPTQEGVGGGVCCARRTTDKKALPEEDGGDQLDEEDDMYTFHDSGLKLRMKAPRHSMQKKGILELEQGIINLHMYLNFPNSEHSQARNTDHSGVCCS